MNWIVVITIALTFLLQIAYIHFIDRHIILINLPIKLILGLVVNGTKNIKL
ncbi:hypothetical protein O59_000952 [Cellvibrio sp. BR]|nr:hypothetical protein O59_000952 [Cellvibrio sp. BR]